LTSVGATVEAINSVARSHTSARYSLSRASLPPSNSHGKCLSVISRTSYAWYTTDVHHPNAGSNFLIQKSPPCVPVLCCFSLVHHNSLINSMNLCSPGEADNQLAMKFETSHESRIFIIMFTRTVYYREPDESNRHSDVVSLTFIAR
jgi:hypothetical protein